MTVLDEGSAVYVFPYQNTIMPSFEIIAPVLNFMLKKTISLKSVPSWLKPPSSFLFCLIYQFLNVATLNQSKSFNLFSCLMRTNYGNIRYRRLYIGLIKLFCRTMSLLKLLDKIFLIHQVGQSTTCPLPPFYKASSEQANTFCVLFVSVHSFCFRILMSIAITVQIHCINLCLN